MIGGKKSVAVQVEKAAGRVENRNSGEHLQ